ncbi:MAG: hypothetical protein K0R39_1681 [Symbiobacteriaceae bacterium]|jgi:hypothetical protein|nr:hypothetical protein [Symbiobacteriaceae bacterium]
MPLPQSLAKASLREIMLDEAYRVSLGAKEVQVQFNPESMTVENRRDDFVRGRPVATLSVTLCFDVTALEPLSSPPSDVQVLTKELHYFLKGGKPLPLGRCVRFLWGSFAFDGWISSISETFDLFAADGTPLRANVTLSISNEGMGGKSQQKG